MLILNNWRYPDSVLLSKKISESQPAVFFCTWPYTISNLKQNNNLPLTLTTFLLLPEPKPELGSGICLHSKCPPSIVPTSMQQIYNYVYILQRSIIFNRLGGMNRWTHIIGLWPVSTISLYCKPTLFLIIDIWINPVYCGERASSLQYQDNKTPYNDIKIDFWKTKLIDSDCETNRL